MMGRSPFPRLSPIFRRAEVGGRLPPSSPVAPRNVLPIGSFVASVPSENASYVSVAIRIRVMPTAVLTNQHSYGSAIRW